MREDICSIPISEIFEPKDGCPFCRMRDMLEGGFRKRAVPWALCCAGGLSGLGGFLQCC